MMVNRTRYRDGMWPIDNVTSGFIPTFMTDALSWIDLWSYPSGQLIDASTNAVFLRDVLSLPSWRLMCEKYLQPYVVNIQNTLIAATTLFTVSEVYTHNAYGTADNTSGNVYCIPSQISDDGDTYMDLYSMNNAALTFRLWYFGWSRFVTDAEKKVLVWGWDATWNWSSVWYLICKVYTKI